MNQGSLFCAAFSSAYLIVLKLRILVNLDLPAILLLYLSVIDFYINAPKFEDEISTERPKVTTKSTKTSTTTTSTTSTTTTTTPTKTVSKAALTSSEAPPKTDALFDQIWSILNNNNKLEEETGRDSSHSSPWWMVGAVLGGIALLVGAVVGAKKLMDNRAAAGYAEATLVANQEDFSDTQSIVQDQQQNH